MSELMKDLIQCIPRETLIAKLKQRTIEEGLGYEDWYLTGNMASWVMGSLFTLPQKDVVITIENDHQWIKLLDRYGQEWCDGVKDADGKYTTLRHFFINESWVFERPRFEIPFNTRFEDYEGIRLLMPPEPNNRFQHLLFRSTP